MHQKQVPIIKRFYFIMIKPSHYDDDGYVIQWVRSAIPSSTLAAMYGLALDCAERRVLGEDVDLRLATLDETNSRIRVDNLVRTLRRDGGRGLIGLVGVQSNQFPRALDLARQFRRHGIPVCIGGFHVSGCLSMLPQLTPELQEALDLGVTLFAGEAEARLEDVLRDAYRNELKPVYNYMHDLPAIDHTPAPILPPKTVRRIAGAQSSFEAGRGCPFLCSFCTIINVQGRKSRFRHADDVEFVVRQNVANGIHRFFITDDNFARNQNWEAVFDRLIELREHDKLKITLFIQIDTECHKIPGFIEKARRAGVRRVFIGLENINPENLSGARKNQNRITEYRRMLHAWRKVRVITIAGYILGFPADTPESILRDIDIVKRELPVDLLEFFILTPLPGSEDHQRLFQRGVQMDPDLNKYDLYHVTTGHERMSGSQWEQVYWQAWDSFYSDEHIKTLLNRAIADRATVDKLLILLSWFCGSVTLEKVHPLEGGLWRKKYRKDRRPGLPIESAWAFYPKYVKELLAKHWGLVCFYWRFYRLRRELSAQQKTQRYTDRALKTVCDEELEELDLFTVNDAAKAAVARAQRNKLHRLKEASV